MGFGSKGFRVFQPFGCLSKLCFLFGSLLSYGTLCLGYPKRDHNFDSHVLRFGEGFRALPLMGLMGDAYWNSIDSPHAPCSISTSLLRNPISPAVLTET